MMIYYLFQPPVDFTEKSIISVFNIIFILNVVVIAFLLVLFALYTNHNMH
jgi:predicted PurR-regulated permease PerM